MTHDAPLSRDRLARRREHLMTEITATPSTIHVEPPRRSRRTARYGLAAAGAIAVATAAVSVVLTIGGDATGLGPTAFAVTPIPHGNVSIDIVSTRASAAEMTRQLRAKGLPIKIATMPASPALV